ncbi:MAG: ATP-binding protein [Caulobacteraceae bacterium]|nr:ATP-binding protein [Caulobacteraceae bacterium]
MLKHAALRWILRREPSWVGYATAVLGVAAATGVRWLAALWTSNSTNFPVFYPAVLVATLIGGLRAGLLALALSTFIIWWYWLPLLHSFPVDRPQFVSVFMFVTTAGMMVAVSQAMRAATRRALEAEDRFRQAHEGSLDGFVIMEPVRLTGGEVIDFRWTHANAAAESLSPRDAVPLVGRRLLEVFPDARESGLFQRYAEILRTGKPDKIEYKLRVDGVDCWRASSGVRIGDSVSLTFRDVTEIIEARRTLEARVAERTRALEESLEERARAEAALAQAQRVETLGRLTGGVAHDFNNLLTVIIGGLDMILRGPDKPERVARLAEAALAAGRRGERLTRQLLAFSRHREIKLEVHDVAAVLGVIEPMIRRAAGEIARLEIEIAPDAGSARFDSAQFEAALLNLVVNAAHATPLSGSIRVRVRRVQVRADQIAGLEPGRYLKVSVADTGAGIPPDVLKRVFEPFFTTKEIGQGSGLGLAQVQGFARQCGGVAAVESRIGEGTTVTLYLPAATGPARELTIPPISTPLDASRTKGETVLLVEDDEAVRALTESLLSECGYRVTTASDGPQALSMLRRGEVVSLLLSDVVMPGGMSGVDLAMSAAELMPKLPIVLMTGYAAGRLAELTPATDWPVLRKPFQVEELAAAVQEGQGGRATTGARV